MGKGDGACSTRLDRTGDTCVRALARRSDRTSASLDGDRQRATRRPMGSGDGTSRPPGTRGRVHGRKPHAALGLRRRVHRPRAAPPAQSWRSERRGLAPRTPQPPRANVGICKDLLQ